MNSTKPCGTPMSAFIKIDKDDYGIYFNQKRYRGMIGSLLYLTVTRHDIMFTVCLDV